MSSLISLLPGLAFLLIVGCGGPVKSRVELSSSISLLSTDHELIFTGRHYASNSRFTVLAEADGFDVEILQGKWEFAIVAWEKNGVGRFTGTTKCGKLVNATVSGAATRLSFDVTTANCNDGFFRRTGFLHASSGELQSLKLKANANLSTITEATSAYTLPPGYVSYRIVYDPKARRNSTTSFQSDCYPLGSSSPLRLPVFGSVPLAFDIRIYTDAACDTEHKIVSLSKGLTESPGTLRIFDSGDETVVYIGDSMPVIIAVNTIQLSLGSTIEIGEERTRSLSFIQPNHYSGHLADTCSATPPAANVTVNYCTCSSGACTLNFTVDNTVGSEAIDKVIFQYTLTDASGNTSNTASARACSGSNSSCTP